MKTAKITYYYIWGADTARGLEVTYRGRILRTFTGHAADKAVMIDKAKRFARNEGFTHWVGDSGRRQSLEGV